MTDRLLAALECPWVDVLGHPTARRLLRREPMRFDFDAVICSRGTARRGAWRSTARWSVWISTTPTPGWRASAACGIVISTDAHSTLRTAATCAGACRWRGAHGWNPDDVLNTRDVETMPGCSAGTGTDRWRRLRLGFVSLKSLKAGAARPTGSARRDPEDLFRDDAADHRQRPRARDRAAAVAAERGRTREGVGLHGRPRPDAARMGDGGQTQDEGRRRRSRHGDRMSDVGDQVARGARVHRLDGRFRWPGGRHVAVIVNVAYEAWSDGVAPGVGPMGNPLPPRVRRHQCHVVGTLRSHARHSAAARSPRPHRRARQHHGQWRAGHPHAGRARAGMADAGHEIVAHSLAQDVVPAGLSAEEDVENIRQTTSLLAGASGVQPAGWISPRGTPRADTARHLLDAGYLWHGDVFDDDRPYLQHVRTGAARGHSADDGDQRSAACDALRPIAATVHRGIRRSARRTPLSHEREAMIIDVTAHAHVYGRPARRLGVRGDPQEGQRAG